MKRVVSKNQQEFPVCITGEPIKIRIYRQAHHTRERYVLTHYDCNGERQRRTFGTFEEAEAEGLKLKKEIRSGGWDLITLRGTERLTERSCSQFERRRGSLADGTPN